MPTPEEIKATQDAEAKATAEKAAAEEAAKKAKGNDPARMQAKLDEQLAEIKRLKEKVAGATTLEEKAKKVDELEAFQKKALGLFQQFGVDLKTETEETLKAKREAEALAAQETSQKKATTAAKIQDAVIDALFEKGMKLDKRDRSMILRQALEGGDVTVNAETDEVSGLPEFIDWAASRFGGQVDDGKGGTKPPRAPQRVSGGAVDERFKDVDSFRKLVDMGESARAEFERKYPDRYAHIHASHRSGLVNPRARVPIAQPAGAQTR